VTIRSSPMIDADRFVATYKTRAYTGQKVPRVQRRIRELSDLRGTEVTLDVATNRKLKNGRLEVRGDDGKTKTYQADLVNNAPERMRFSFVLEQTGRYAIYFTSTDGETYGDALPYRITVRSDMPPKPVVLTKPGQNVALAINDLLELEGNAHDDIGVQSLV